MIQRDYSKLSIAQQCKLVRLSRSAFYYTPTGIDVATLELMKGIDRVFTKYPFFGSRQIAAYLVACDFRISFWNRADNSIFQV